MEDCKKYLEKAKQHNWTLDLGDLMNTFNLTKDQVKHCIDEVYC